MYGITQKQIVMAYSNTQQNKGEMIAYSLQTILYFHKVSVSIPLHMKRSNFQVRQYNTCFGVFWVFKLIL